MRRRAFIAGLFGGIALPALAQAHRPGTVHRIGILHPGDLPLTGFRTSAFLEGVYASSGLGEKNLEIRVRVAAGDLTKLPGLAAEMASERIDLLLAVSPMAVRAARAAMHSIPIVALDLESDPMANGWVASLAQPGGNLTGIFLDFPDMRAKCLQLLSEAFGTTRVAVIWDSSTGREQIDSVLAAAEKLGLATRVLEIDSLAAVETAFATAAREGVQSALLLSSPVIGVHTRAIAESAIRHRLAAITLFPEFAQDGGMMAYGPDLQALYRQAGAIAGHILRGADPGTLPVERPTRLRFVVNLKTAEALGIALPTATLARADEVIE
jgi:putative ABC transport system substrate-binding protein